MKVIKTNAVIICSLLMILGVVLHIYSAPSNIQAKTLELKSYCRARGYNTDYGLLVDYSRHSFQQRLYIVDMNTGDILMRSLCGHGRGGQSNLFKGDFSNVPGSYCSSLGHYKVGRERKMQSYPIDAFELDGLDMTNSNARARAILIHPSIGPRSLGCITLPFLSYKRLSKKLHSQCGSVIVWAYQ